MVLELKLHIKNMNMDDYYLILVKVNVYIHCIYKIKLVRRGATCLKCFKLMFVIYLVCRLFKADLLNEFVQNWKTAGFSFDQK